MAALNELDVRSLIPKQTEEMIRAAINRLFWGWYDSNKDNKLFRISLFRGLVKKQIYVRDLQDVFTLLFGSENGLSTTYTSG